MGLRNGFAGVPSHTSRRAYVRGSLMFRPIFFSKIVKSVVIIVPNVLGCLDEGWINCLGILDGTRLDHIVV